MKDGLKKFWREEGPVAKICLLRLFKIQIIHRVTKDAFVRIQSIYEAHRGILKYLWNIINSLLFL